MSNESPYTRFGRKLDVETDGHRHELRPRDNLLTLAGRYLGEWRLWREILKRNTITNPFDLDGSALGTTAGSPAYEYERLEAGAEPELVDVTEEFGISVIVNDCAPGQSGHATLEIVDVDVDVFELRVNDPAGGGTGEAVTIRAGDFYDPGGTPRNVGALLRAASSWWVALELTPDAFFILWTHRSLLFDVSRALETGRGELLVPRIGSIP